MWQHKRKNEKKRQTEVFNMMWRVQNNRKTLYNCYQLNRLDDQASMIPSTHRHHTRCGKFRELKCSFVWLTNQKYACKIFDSNIFHCQADSFESILTWFILFLFFAVIVRWFQGFLGFCSIILYILIFSFSVSVQFMPLSDSNVFHTSNFHFKHWTCRM